MTEPDPVAELIGYLTARPVDLKAFGLEEVFLHFVHNYLNRANQRRLCQFLGKKLGDILPDDYGFLPPPGQGFFADWLEADGWVRQVRYDHGADSPAWMRMSLDQAMPVVEDWCIHFTDHADAIARDGFRYGVDNMNALAITHRHSIYGTVTRREASEPGYNFALMATDPRVAQHADNHSYGEHAVVFRARGAKVWHDGDQEDQIIFWGPDVAAEAIVAVHRQPDGSWRSACGQHHGTIEEVLADIGVSVDETSESAPAAP